MSADGDGRGQAPSLPGRFAILHVSMINIRHRLQVRVTRAVTGLLRFLGVRENVVRWRLARARRRRADAEARGDDRLSRPGLHEVDAKLNALIDRAGGFFIVRTGLDEETASPVDESVQLGVDFVQPRPRQPIIATGLRIGAPATRPCQTPADHVLAHSEEAQKARDGPGNADL